MTDSVFDYTNPGTFLKWAYQRLKRKEPGVSHRYISEVLGQKSSATFWLLIEGRTHPTPRVIDGLAKVFSLDRRERDHLSLLFALRKMEDPSLTDYVLRILAGGESSQLLLENENCRG